MIWDKQLTEFARLPKRNRTAFPFIWFNFDLTPSPPFLQPRLLRPQRLRSRGLLCARRQLLSEDLLQPGGPRHSRASHVPGASAGGRHVRRRLRGPGPTRAAARRPRARRPLRHRCGQRVEPAGLCHVPRRPALSRLPAHLPQRLGGVLLLSTPTRRRVTVGVQAQQQLCCSCPPSLWAGLVERPCFKYSPITLIGHPSWLAGSDGQCSP